MCYLLLFHIGLGVVAITCFIKGKLHISHRWVATGTPAYLAGVILLLPFPLTAIILVALVAIVGAQGRFWDAMDAGHWGNTHEITFGILTLGITAACVSLAFLIAMIWARDPSELEAEKRRGDDWDDRWD